MSFAIHGWAGFLLAALTAATAMAGEHSFTIAGLRVMPARWDKEGNLQKLDRYAREAAQRGAQVIVTPECFLDGYVGNDSILKEGVTRERYQQLGEPLDGPSLERVGALARELNVYLLFGFPERESGRIYNALVVFGPDGSRLHHYRKTHILDEGFNTEGSKLFPFDTPLGRWGALICYDRQLPETSRVLAVNGARLILVPSYGSCGEMNTVMMRTRAYENSVYVAFVHPRRCLFIDPRGTIVAEDQGDHDQVVTAEIHLDNERLGRGPIEHRKPALYSDLVK
jgi:predicted amidohydrolase